MAVRRSGVRYLAALVLATLGFVTQAMWAPQWVAYVSAVILGMVLGVGLAWLIVTVGRK